MLRSSKINLFLSKWASGISNEMFYYYYVKTRPCFVKEEMKRFAIISKASLSWFAYKDKAQQFILKFEDFFIDTWIHN